MDNCIQFSKDALNITSWQSTCPKETFHSNSHQHTPHILHLILPSSPPRPWPIPATRDSQNDRLGVVDPKKQLHGVLVVDEPAKGRTDAVAQQPLGLGRQRLCLVRGDHKVLVLDLAGHAAAEEDADGFAGFVSMVAGWLDGRDLTWDMGRETWD